MTVRPELEPPTRLRYTSGDQSEAERAWLRSNPYVFTPPNCIQAHMESSDNYSLPFYNPSIILDLSTVTPTPLKNFKEPLK